MKLAVTSLRWGVGAGDIVRGVDLNVERGEFVGVIGPNGSGKSSLLRCAYRVNKPRFGSILLDGEEVWKLRAREFARRAAAVPQEMPGQFDFTVREIAAMGRYPHKKALQRDDAHDFALVDRALEYVGMLDRAGRSFASLSGGEKQRALIARAIAQEADFLILDEPTNHLDIYYQLEIMDLLRSLGVTSLVVMHDLNLAAQYCDRVYVMKDGNVFASGAPAAVLTPELIRAVYRVEAGVAPDPATKRPRISFLRRLGADESL